MPRPDNAIAKLGAALAKVAAYQSPMKLNSTTRTYFERVAKISSPEEAFLLTHIEDPVIGPVVQETFRLGKNPAHLAYNSMIRNSISPNMVQGGIRVNIVPAEAEAALDVRMLPGEDVELLKAELRRIINDPAIEIVNYEGVQFPGAPATSLETDLFKALERAAGAVFPGAAILPTMSTGATDSAKTRAKGVQTYGVGTLRTDDDEARMHGNDERVLVEGIKPYLEFVYRAVVDVAASKQ